MRREDELTAEVDRTRLAADADAAQTKSLKEALAAKHSPQPAFEVDSVREALTPDINIPPLQIVTAATAERYNRLTNSTWRLLEEQRVDALETVAEIDAQIRALNERREDAVRAAEMCAAAQKAAG
jgi:hypothetical protein